MAKLILCLLLLASIVLLTRGDQCPSLESKCKCNYDLDDTTKLEEIECRDLGERTQVPSFNDSTSILQKLKMRGRTYISSVQRDALTGLRIRHLDLSAIRLKTIEEDAFAGLGEYLETLYLDNNHLEDLPVKVFEELTNLITLRLEENRFTVVKESYFTGLTNLRNLYLEENYIARVETRAFRDLKAIERLMIFRNQLTEVIGDTYSDLPTLIDLNLRENNLGAISSNALWGLESLENLDLSLNNLTTLPAELLRDAVKLQRVDFAINNINTLEQRLFSRTTLIEYIDLSSNEISSFHSATFGQTKELQYLFLSRNKLTAIPEFAFENTNKMLSLHLQENQLQTLELNTFKGLVGLEKLNLFDNMIQELPNSIFDSVHELKRVDISNNQISKIGYGPFDFTKNLVFVDMSQNKLDKVYDTWFQRSELLEEVLLADNLIKNIEPDTFVHNLGLEILDLRGNRLTEIDDEVFAPLNLTVLKLSANPLQLVPVGLLNRMVQLNEFYLENTCITDLPNDSFSPYSALTEIYLRHNAIHTLYKGTFEDLTQLKKLDLSYNNISSVEAGVFDQNDQLEYLDLSYNHLRQDMLVGITASKTRLQWLNLANNSLTSLSQDILKDTPKLEMYLAGNPWHCDCQIAWLRQPTADFHDYHLTFCSTPASLQNSSLVCFSSASCNENPTPDSSVREFCDNDPDWEAKEPSTMSEHVFRYDPDVCVPEVPETTTEMETTTIETTTEEPTTTAVEETTVFVLPPIPLEVSITLAPTIIVVSWEAEHNLTEEVRYTITLTEMSSENVTTYEVYNILSGSYYFRNLTEELTYQVCVELASNSSEGMQSRARYCSDPEPLPSASPSTSSDAFKTLYIVLVSVFAGALVIAAVCGAIYILFFKKKKIESPTDSLRKQLGSWVRSFESIDQVTEMAEQTTITWSVYSSEPSLTNSHISNGTADRSWKHWRV